MADEIMNWLRSCKCQQYECMHKNAADRIEQLQKAGDDLANAMRSGGDTGWDKAIDAWDEIRHNG